MINCSQCNGACCKYVTATLDVPETHEDWDHIKWMIAHKDVIVYQDTDGDWLVEFQTPCKHLDENDLCTKYGNRPDICKNHGTDECMINGEGEVAVIKFTCIEDVEEHLKAKPIKELTTKAKATA